MDKRPELTERTRACFVEAFLSLRQKKEIEQITVRELAALAGYNRATFYRYFPDVYAIQEGLQREIVGDIGRIAAQYCDGKTLDWGLVDVLIPLYQKKKDRLRVVLHPKSRSSLIELLKLEMIPVFQRLFGLAELSARDQCAFEAFFAGMTTLLGRWVCQPEEIGLDELSQLAQTLLGRWLLPELGRGDH